MATSLRGGIGGMERPSMWQAAAGGVPPSMWQGKAAGVEAPESTPGLQLPQTSAANFNSGDSGEQTASNITKYRKKLHDDIYTPMLEETIGQIGQSGIVDRAKERAQTDPRALQDRMDRQQSRMGSNMSVAAQQYQQGNVQRQGTLRGDWNVNNARIAEDEFDMAGRRSAINIGSSMLNTAQQGAMQAANVEAGIKAQNDAGKAANRAAMVGFGTTIIGGAMSM
jgi:hypothetical protein